MNERLLYIGVPENNQAPIDYLQKKGYEVHLTHGLRPSLRALSQYTFDAIIIDLGDVTAINSKRISHKAGRRPEKPFIILISGHRSQRFDELVYDDTLIRPFTSRALEQCLRKHLDQRRNAVVQLGPITLDRRTQVVQTPQGLARLTFKQFQLLDYFIRNAGKLVTRRDLMMAVWDTDYLGDTRTLD
ncbi:MAG: response regulator transcription factor, partial [Chloroflexi bacterium]|nr:response regulator transcription factor [Chloroflexota bacterium]